MFGKRDTAASAVQRPPVSAPPPAQAERIEPSAGLPPRIEPTPVKQSAPAPSPGKGQTRAQADTRSEDYYQIKTLIFSALIDTIDLAQLALANE